jgi:hypothetical protein
MVSRKRLGIILTCLGALMVIIHFQFLNPEFKYIKYIGCVLFFIIGPLLVPDYEQKKTKPNHESKSH